MRAASLNPSAPRTATAAPGASRPAFSPHAARPRLLILTVGFTVGGAEQLILTTAPRLQRDGFEVTVACLKGWGVLGDELEARGVRAVALGAKGWFDLRAFGRLLSMLRRDRVQIVRGHLFWANLTARLVGRIAPVPVVVTTHHDTDVWMRWYHRLAERATAPLSDAVTTCSEAVRRHAIETLGIRPGLVHTLPNAIEIPEVACDPLTRERVRRELGAGAGDILVGTLGRLVEPKKGLMVFLAAARSLLRDVPRIRFVLVGDGPQRAALEERATREGVSHCTVFAGIRRDVAEVMRALDLFVQPSLWEGFGLTALEAMAAGTPVVATRVGGVPEVIVDGETGLLVPPGDAEALAAACARVLSDRDLAARLGRSGRERVRQHFDIERLVGQIEALYRELLERDRTPEAAPSGRQRSEG